MKKLGRILTIYFKASEQVIKDIGEEYQYNFEKEKNLESSLIYKREFEFHDQEPHKRFKKELDYPEKINDFSLDTYHRWIEVFILSSLLELPTITVPVGFNKNKLPMGMQIIGKKNDDLKVLAFAKKYEQMFNYSKIKPEI